MRGQACPLYRHAMPIAAVSVGLFALVALLVVMGATTPLDLTIEQLARSSGSGALHSVSLFATMIGTGPWLVGMAVLAGLLVAREGRRTEAVLPLLPLVASWVGNSLLKSFFLRQRPTTELWPPGLFGSDQYSFPSGHTMDSMALYSLLACWTWAYWQGRGRAVTAVLVSLIPIAIGLSRIVLGVHWASDVLGGWLAGVAVMSLVVLAWTRFGPREGS